MADVCYYIYNLKMDDFVISVLILLFVAAGNCSMRLSNLCDKTKNETCRYIWQGAVGNQHICSYCPHKLLNDENNKNHQCIQNNINKRDPFEIKNDLFPYCYSNVPGAIVPSCGKLPNVTYGVWDCGNFVSPHNVTVYYTCKLICDHQSASVHNVTVVRCNESRKWNSSLDTLSCVNNHLEPDIHNHTEDVDSNEATVPIHDHTEDVDSNEATVPKELVTIPLLLLIIIVTTGMVIIAILLLYFCCRNARSRRQTPVLRNHDNTSSPKTHVMTNGCSPGNDDGQGPNNRSGENIALLTANKSLPQEMKFCDNRERSHNENNDEDHQSDTNDPESIHSTHCTQSDHNHYKTYVVEKDSFSFDQSKSKTNIGDFHVTTESEHKEEDRERSNNQNGNEDHQSADTNDQESIYSAHSTDHNHHETYVVDRTSSKGCQDGFSFDQSKSNTEDLHITTGSEHKEESQELSNNLNGNKNRQSIDKNDPESINSLHSTQSDHEQHKTYVRERTSPSDCQDSFRFENEQSITNVVDLHVRTEPEHNEDDQSLEHMNELFNTYHGMRLSSLMNLNSE